MSNYYEDNDQVSREARGASAVDGLGGSTNDILQTIMGRIISAEERQAAAIEQMQQRIAKLSQGAEAARPVVPIEFRDAFGRVEQAMQQLAARLGKQEPDLATSTAGAETDSILQDESSDAVGRQNHRDTRSGRAFAAGMEPFDVTDLQTAGNPEEPWDTGSAEELTRLYETGAAGLIYSIGRRAGGCEQGNSTGSYMNSASGQAMAAVTAFTSSGAAGAGIHDTKGVTHAVSKPAIEKSWVKEQLSDLSARIEGMLSASAATESLSMMGERFDALEQKFNTAISGLASQSDVSGLGDVELCIAAMAEQLERTHAELFRVSEIEGLVRKLADQLSEEQLVKIAKSVALPAQPVDAPVIDVAGIADAVAARIAEQQPVEAGATSGPGVEKGEIDELKALMRGLIAEQRNEGAQTTSMLETMQEAMIRLLDRMDALEQAPVAASAVTEKAAPVRQDAATVERNAQAVAAAKRSFDAKLAANNRHHPQDGGQAAPPAPSPKTAAQSPSFEDYKPRRVEPANRQADLSGDQQPVAEVSNGDKQEASKAPADRQQFMAAARRAALQANSRAKQTASGPSSPEDGQDFADEEFDLQAPAKPASSSTRVRVLAAAIAVMIIGAGVGVTKLMIAEPQVANRQLNGHESQGREMIGQNATRRGSVPQPVQPNVKPANSSLEQGGSNPSVQPVGVTIEPTRPGVTAADIERRQRHHQFAMWSTGVGASQPEATTVPASLIPSAEPDKPYEPVTQGPASQRTTSLPPALIGPLSMRIAAANGEPSAEFEVGARFAEGKGVQQDFEQAVKWYTRAATRSFALAQYRLATLYERGLGVKKDLARAKVWYERAASQGNVKAMHNLAVLSAGSSKGGAPDYGTAARWFKEAAMRGLKDSQFNLAILHETGLGVNRDLNE
ncbi:MAG TPA: hypothetical protein VMX97_13230, partial [Hyphomicrobiaceae bacterium]|nr:hypothetical protein [Hyphomicrobiaceae bacterium]